MTDNERNRWHSALQELKRNGEYDRISWEHRQVSAQSHLCVLIGDFERYRESLITNLVGVSGLQRVLEANKKPQRKAIY